MTIIASCNACNTKFTIGNEFAGQTTKCSKCHSDVQILEQPFESAINLKSNLDVARDKAELFNKRQISFIADALVFYAVI